MQCIEPKTYVLQVVKLLEQEADAITKVAHRLQSERVERAVELLANCLGKVVLIGVGKSGIIAQKIAATLTSTGTSAVFLHPSDALHGDIGIVSGGDVAVILSNSGETDELIAMLPYLKCRQIPIIAIVGRLRSTLAYNADVIMDATIDREACPFNLVPTSSTTVALAIGDALAIALMQVKGLTPEDFAFNHPAGRLGKRLTLRVRDLMHSGTNNPVVSPEAAWIEVVSAISQGGLGAVNVVDDLGQLVGIITDGDLRRSLQKIEFQDVKTLNASAIATSNPVAIAPDILAYHALEVMENRPSQISILPVVEGQQCIGLIRLHDIVRSGL
jgi:arabinose-5-phosphate isomerase